MNRFFSKRVLPNILCILAILTVLPGFTLPLHADAVTEAVPGGIVKSKYLKDDGITAVSHAELWTVAKPATSSVISEKDGSALRIYSADGVAKTTLTFEEDFDCNGFRELGIKVRSLSGKTSTATLSVTHGTGTASVTVQLPSGEEHYIFVPLPENTNSVSGMEFTASCASARNMDSSSAMSMIIGSTVRSAEDHSRNIQKYSAFAIDGLDGTAVKTGSMISASPIMPTLVADADESYAAVITLHGNGGGMAFHYAPDGKSYNVYGSAVLSDDRKTYVFPIDELGSDSSYKIELSGVQNTAVTIDSVEFVPLKISSFDSSLGTVSKCTLTNGEVHVAGNITRDAAVKHIDGSLCIYEIPMWQDTDSALSDDPAKSMSISTSFSFNLPVSEDFSIFSSYVIAIKDTSGVYPISDRLYPNAGYYTEAKSSVSAISGVSLEEAFYSGYDKYVIDVNADELFLEKSGEGSTVFTFDGYPFYPDKTLSNNIALKEQFLTAAGIGIIFRINTADVLSPADPTHCRLLGAAVSYLCDLFSPYGIIVDIPVSGDLSVSEQAYDAASFARLASAASHGTAAVYTSITYTESADAYAWFVSKYLTSFPKAGYTLLLPPSVNSDFANGITACATDGGYTGEITYRYNDSSKIVNELPHVLDLTNGVQAPHSEDFSSFRTTESADVAENFVTLWDFTKSYDSDGFTVPAGPTEIHTVTDGLLENHTGISACRCLKTTLGGNSHMIIAKPKASMDLSQNPRVRFLISCVSESRFSFDIIFISESKRAIFTAEYNGSGIYSPVCDLSQTDISDKIDRIAIVLRSGDSVELGICKVVAEGESDGANVYITDDTPITEIHDSPEQTNDILRINKAYVAVGGLIIITIFVFALLSKKKE